jgi:hypothetical protein
MGVELLVPHYSKKRDPTPKRSALLSRFRYRIDTVFSQLTERYCVKKVWARPVAAGKQTAAQSPLSHRGLPAQPSDGQSPTALEATHLKKPLIGLVKPSHGYGVCFR